MGPGIVRRGGQRPQELRFGRRHEGAGIVDCEASADKEIQARDADERVDIVRIQF